MGGKKLLTESVLVSRPDIADGAIQNFVKGEKFCIGVHALSAWTIPYTTQKLYLKNVTTPMLPVTCYPLPCERYQNAPGSFQPHQVSVDSACLGCPFQRPISLD